MVREFRIFEIPLGGWITWGSIFIKYSLGYKLCTCSSIRDICFLFLYIIKELCRYMSETVCIPVNYCLLKIDTA